MKNDPVRKMVLSHYEKIYTSIKHVAKEFSVKRVPLNFVDTIIAKAKTKTESKDKDIIAYFKQINKTLDTLKDLCKKQSKIIGDDCVSLNEIRKMITALKDGFATEYDKNMAKEES